MEDESKQILKTAADKAVAKAVGVPHTPPTEKAAEKIQAVLWGKPRNSKGKTQE